MVDDVKLERTPGQWSATTFEEIKDFNILVLGERQSGKSTLIEAIKNYALHDILDPKIPSYTPTTDVTSTFITTTLPRFSTFENVDGQDDGSLPRPLVNDDIRRYLSLDDEEYEQKRPYLHTQKDQQTQNPYKFNFRMIDTPGLDFIKDGSKSILEGEESGVFVSKTLPAIIKQLGPTYAVHLVLLVVPDADNYNNSDAVDFYRSILPAFDFITVVAHRETKSNKATPVSKALQHRHKSRNMDSYADQLHVIINNLLIRDDPIRDCLARNDIRRILELAVLNEPVFMLSKKPSFIKDLDDFLEDRYSEVLKTIHDAVATAKDSSPFHTILQLTKIQCDEDIHNEVTLSSSPLKLVFSRRFENTWDAPISDGLIEVEMESTEGEIAHVDILQHNVEIVEQDGGVYANRFRLVFRWISAFHGVLDIRIYVNAAAISLRSSDIPTNITETVHNAVSNSKNPSNQHKLIMEFLERYRHFHIMHRLTSATVVHPEAIQILNICGIDQTKPIDLFECVEKLETAYLSIADTCKPELTSPKKTSSELIVGDGGSAKSVYPSVNSFRSHLNYRRFPYMTPCLKIEHNESQKENQKQVPEIQLRLKETLDRLATIQHRIQSVITQTYELHEYSIPRLFIILPKPARLRDTSGKLLSNHFRLYFLCECGKHTMTGGSTTQHEIHLAKHEGYDIEKPNEFFDKYGSYILTLMQKFKYGIATASVVVPALSTLKPLDFVEAIKGKFDPATKSIGNLVDEAINFLETRQGNATNIDVDLSQTEFNKLEAPEGVDLRQLESYLKVNDEARVLGNLYRIVTSEGHVKWVCFDHYRETYSAAVMRQLKVVVEVSGGKFIEKIGKIEITVMSSTIAKQFYDAMVQAQGIQELDITFGWDAAMSDLRAFEAAVVRTNIVQLTVDGTNLKGPAYDVINRGRRFDPIVELMSNRRIQFLCIKNFNKLLFRVSDSSAAARSMLRVLWIDSDIDFDDKPSRLAIAKLLGNCPPHVQLKLNERSTTTFYKMMDKPRGTFNSTVLRNTFGSPSSAFDCVLE
ncbi:hypothetical protein BGX26_000286, partial [Mortierella sp. AD094]